MNGSEKRSEQSMRRDARSFGSFLLVAAMAAVAGCSDDPRVNADGGAGTGGRAGGGSGGSPKGGNGGSGGGIVGGTGGGGDGGGGTGGSVGGAGGTAGATGGAGPGGAAGKGGATSSGGTAGGAGAAGSPGTGGATGGRGGSAGSGGATGGAGGTGTAGTTGGAAGGATGGAGTGGGGVTGSGGTSGASGVAGNTGTGGATGAAGSGVTLAPPPISGGAVLNSDFASTSISLLNPQGALVRADCVHSTSTGSGAKTISGDVVLPSQPQRGGQVVLIDRGNVALTFVNPTTCAFDRQISVKGGFAKANPHDVVIVSDSKAYVTRYGKNVAPGSRIEEGDDLLMVDPRDGTVGGRIDLSAYTTTDNPASPDRAIIAAGKVVVTLNRWNAGSFTYAKGSVVIIDPDTDRVLQQLPLGDLKNCEGLDVLPATKTVLVACGGSYGVEQAIESGIAVIDLSATPAKLARIISGVAFPTPPVTFAWAVAMPSASSPTRAFTSTMGSFTPSVPDHLYFFDYLTGTTMSFGSASPFDLGKPAGANGRLVIPDANAAMPRIHVFDANGAGVPTESSAFVADTVNGLPPREVAWY
jgi:hypothetical protein